MASCKGPIAYSLFILLTNLRNLITFTQYEQKTNNYLTQSIKLFKLNRPHVHLKKALSKKEFLLTEHMQRLYYDFEEKRLLGNFNSQMFFFSRKHYKFTSQIN